MNLYLFTFHLEAIATEIVLRMFVLTWKFHLRLLPFSLPAIVEDVDVMSFTE